MNQAPHIGANIHSSNHRAEVLASKRCGCFHRLNIFSPAKIQDWVDYSPRKDTAIKGVGCTALCPKCGIDSVIGSNSGYPITTGFLETMRRHWF